MSKIRRLHSIPLFIDGDVTANPETGSWCVSTPAAIMCPDAEEGFPPYLPHAPRNLRQYQLPSRCLLIQLSNTIPHACLAIVAL